MKKSNSIELRFFCLCDELRAKSPIFAATPLRVLSRGGGANARGKLEFAFMILQCY
jgi:hypothetical protein